MIEFRLLGPVEVLLAGRTLAVRRPQQRAVVAALAVDTGRLVPMEVLLDRVWGATPPERARRALHAHLARIRRQLADHATRPGADPVELAGRNGGYVLTVDPDRVDLHRFRRLVERARGADCAEPRRAELLREALGLWQGQPLAGVPGEWAERMRRGWERQRLDAVLAWGEAELLVANPEPVIGRLAELVDEHPLVEPLAALLMRALCASGRGAEALDCYARTRQRLADELGVDPGAELRALHKAILHGDLEPPAPGSRSRSRPVFGPPAPAQLPPDVSCFAGRGSELVRLDSILAAAGERTGALAIIAISGPAGVGKTALAVHWAHRLRLRFPDGQLFIDLHGYTQGLAPIEPGEALNRMLRALGVPGSQIPVSLDERAALFRTRLADQQMLIVLDNAATETQVAQLLPGSPGCLVLVTSRRRLAGLDQTHSLALDMLPPTDAVILFTRTAGDERLASEPSELVAETVELCGRLPLAIRIATARLRSHPAWNLALLVERLRDQQHRLAELEAGHRSVTAALDLSYQHLDNDPQRTYRLLGLPPGPDIDAYATAALLGTTHAHARRMLDQLLDAHLLLEPVAGRYRFHDLVRAHAAATATREDTEPGARTALNRLFDYYRHTVSVAMDAAYPYERERRPQIPAAHTPIPDLPGPASALEWLGAELPNLLAAGQYAAEHGWPAHILHLSTMLHRHLRTRGRYRDAEVLHDQALTTARATRDRIGELDALVGLGVVYRRQGQYAPAADHFEQALRIARTTDHRTGEVDALTGLGQVHLMQGRHAPAADHFEQALRIAQTTGHRTGELDVLTGLGWIHWLHGRDTPAADHFERALRIARATGHRTGEVDALVGLGVLYRRQARYAPAADRFERALRIAQTTGHRTGELSALAGLGHSHRRQGRHAEATDDYQQLLHLSGQTNDHNGQFEALQGLGRVRHATGHPDAAIAHHDQALVLAGALDQPHDQARAHDGLAHAYHAMHQPDRARQHWQQALRILHRLGVDHTDDEEANLAAIRAHLTDLDRR